MSREVHRNCVREEIRFPNEILAIIINNLVEDDDRTLAALASCRLASHALYSPATPLLFSSIELTERVDVKKQATKLKQLLSTSNIAASVHTLTLRCQKASLENAITGTLISAIIYRLPHIRTFILESERGSLDFSAITEDLASAIRALCRSPNLRTLDFGDISYFPMKVITTCPNLQCLRLSCVKFCYVFQCTYTIPIDEASSLQPYNLDYLEIDADSLGSLGFGISSYYYDGRACAKYFSRIKNLRLKNTFRDFASFQHGWDIMLLASQTLTTLDLTRDDNSPMYAIHFPLVLDVRFDLGQFPALRHFKIQIRISFWDNVPSTLCFLNRLLSISSSTSGIETLEIMITWVNVESEYQQDLFSSDAGWPTLDEVLSSEDFASLKKVVLGLGLEIRGGNHSKAYYDNQMNLDLAKSPPYVNNLFSMFGTLTSTGRTLELYVEII